jgi:hypothetical protein
MRCYFAALEHRYGPVPLRPLRIFPRAIEWWNPVAQDHPMPHHTRTGKDRRLIGVKLRATAA